MDAVAEKPKPAEEITDADDAAMSNADKRAAIRNRIAAGEARLAERENRSLTDQITDVGESVIEFTKKHPLTVIGGALVAGIVISALFPSSPTRRVGRRIPDWANSAAGLAALYSQRALDAAEDAGRAGYDRMEDLGDAIGDEARGLRRSARYYAGGAGDRTRIAGRNLSKASRRSLRGLRSTFGH